MGPGDRGKGKGDDKGNGGHTQGGSGMGREVGTGPPIG